MNIKNLKIAFAIAACLTGAFLAKPVAALDACKSDSDCVSSDPALAGSCVHWQCKYFKTAQPDPKPLAPYYTCAKQPTQFHMNVCDDASLPDHDAYQFECLTMKEMLKLDPSLDSNEALCCLTVEGPIDSAQQYENFINDAKYRAEKMNQCGGKMPNYPTPPVSDPSEDLAAQIEKCSSIKVSVGGDVSGSMNVCCNVVNNGGSIDEIIQACTNDGSSISTGNTDGTSTVDDGTSASDSSSAGDKTADGSVTPATDSLHVAGGTGGCSLIR